jgi:hypothetical protein
LERRCRIVRRRRSSPTLGLIGKGRPAIGRLARSSPVRRGSAGSACPRRWCNSMARRNLGAHSARRLAGGHLALAVAEALRQTPTLARVRVKPLRRRSQSAGGSHPARSGK